MHPEICRFPSLHFYENKLLNGAQMATKSAPFHENACHGPYMFFDIIDGHEHHERNSTSLSLYNESEVDAAIRILKFLLSRYPSEFASGRIGIITPYRGQLSLLRSRFSGVFGSNIITELEFNTVDGFQGREVDILVLSTVRASDSTNSSSIGFVADVRRMNVALTRAKLSLWIVGNARTLQKNLHWAALIENAKERNLFISVSRPYDSIFGNAQPSSTGNTGSKLNSYSRCCPKQAGKVRHGNNAKGDLIDGKLHQHSLNLRTDDSSSSELTKRKCPLPCLEGVGDIAQLETDSSTKDLIRKTKEAKRSSKHDISNKLCEQSSSIATSSTLPSAIQSKPLKETDDGRPNVADYEYIVLRSGRQYPSRKNHVAI